MDYLSVLLIDPTRPSEEAQLGPVWSNQHPLLAKWALVLPALTVPQRKAVLTCMRVQQPIVSNPRLQKLVMEQFPQDATYDIPESIITPGLSQVRMDCARLSIRQVDRLLTKILGIPVSVEEWDSLYQTKNKYINVPYSLSNWELYKEWIHPARAESIYRLYSVSILRELPSWWSMVDTSRTLYYDDVMDSE